MNIRTNLDCGAPSPLFSAAAFALAVVLMASCEKADDINSELTCQTLCTKDFDCADQVPNADETAACVADCRNSIEDDCGNDDQASANTKINECVDLACDEYSTCMVDAPECFGFASN